MISKPKTSLEFQASFIIASIKHFFNQQLTHLSIQLLSILLGFFISTALSTIPAQTGDWGIIASAIIVTNQEIISKITYQQIKNYKYLENSLLSNIFKYCNSIKIGILYGLFVDAFKLGS